MNYDGWAIQFPHKPKPSIWSIRSTRQECRLIKQSFDKSFGCNCKIVKVTVEAV